MTPNEVLTHRAKLAGFLHRQPPSNIAGDSLSSEISTFLRSGLPYTVSTAEIMVWQSHTMDAVLEQDHTVRGHLDLGEIAGLMGDSLSIFMDVTDCPLGFEFPTDNVTLELDAVVLMISPGPSPSLFLLFDLYKRGVRMSPAYKNGVSLTECGPLNAVLEMLRFARQHIVVPHQVLAPMVTRTKNGKKRVASAPPQTVGIVTLRAAVATIPPPEQDTEPFTTSTNTEAESREWSCRWKVRSHVRRQWYPSRKCHEYIVVNGYEKGPDDKPLREQVAVVSR